LQSIGERPGAEELEKANGESLSGRLAANGGQGKVRDDAFKVE
jgi:hypothetical protein